MRILEVCRSYFPSIGGLESFVSSRTKIYDSLKIDYRILTTDYSTKKMEEEQNDEKVIRLKQYTPYNITPCFDKKIFDSFDIISINQIGNYVSDKSISIAYSLKKKILLTPHLYFHTSRFVNLKKIHQRYFSRNLLKKVDKIICFTDFEISYWTMNYNLPLSKLIKIPHYFKNNVMRVTKTKKIDKERFILYLGRNFNNKRIDLLLKAYTACKGINFKLYVTIEKKDLQPELIELSNSDQRIKFLGYISEVKKNELLSTCKALILPSEYEAFGIVCFEASAYAKPLLCSKLPTLKEILNKQGVLFFDNNIESIVSAINELDKTDDLTLKRMGEINKNNIANFSFEKNIELYKSLLKEIKKDG